MLRLLAALGRRIEATPAAALWTPSYGLARSLLAIGTAGTLVFTTPDVLFHPVVATPRAPHCFGAAGISVFCVVSEPWSLQAARWVAVSLLILVATGWRPRLTAVPHWWISFSLQNSASIIDGGDQVTAVVTLLLLPLALSDPRRWHWSIVREEPPSSGLKVCGVVGRCMILLQVAGLYFHAAVAKMGVSQWANGTAIYYWFTDPTYAPPPWLAGPMQTIVMSSIGVVLVTWAVLMLELALALALAFPVSVRKVLLVLGIGFHAAIAVAMGLLSFALAMIAALLIYLAPPRLGFKGLALATQGIGGNSTVPKQ